MRILALDLGDVWTGTAISDPLKIISTPLKTIKTINLINEIQEIINNKNIEKIIIGYPKTMKGNESHQTKKILNLKEKIQTKFKNIKIILWDERLSSKRANLIKKSTNKEDKIHKHSIAAALILELYLQFINCK